MSISVVNRGLASRTAPTVVFIHGWPDTDVVFEKQYGALEDKFRLVSLILPGFRRGDTPAPRFGIPFDKIAAMLAETVKRETEGCPTKPMVVCHDWGCTMSNEMMHQQPDLFRRAVFFDVGCGVDYMPFKPMMFVLYYHMSAIALYLFMPRFLADPLTRFVAKTTGGRDLGRVHSGMNHMYLQFWRHQMFQPLTSMGGKTFPPVPTLFLWGTQKSMKIHSDSFLKHLDETPGCGHKSFPGDHWFFQDAHNVDKVNEELVRFLSA